MGLRTRLINALGGVEKTNNAIVQGASRNEFLKYGSRGDTLSPTWADIQMPDEDLYRGYSYAVIQKRGNKVASLARENLRTWAKPEVVDEYQKKNESPLHPYLKVIEESTKFTEKQFWKNISIYLDLAGRYYLGVVRSYRESSVSSLPAITSDVKEFIMLNPYEIRRVVDKDGNLAGYVERKNDGRYREWPIHQIIEMRELNPFDGDKVWSMTSAAREAVYTINQSGDYTRQTLNGNLDAPGILASDVILDDTEFENFRERVRQHRKGEPIFGNGAGAITWNPMQVDLDKAALADINEINRTMLFAVSGTSKTSLGIEQSGTTRETARVQSEQFISDTAQPRLEDIVDFLNLDYKQHYKKEYDTTGYTIEIASAVSRDYDTMSKATATRQEQFNLAQTLIQSGYTKESASQYALGEIELSDLEEDPNFVPPEEQGGEDENPAEGGTPDEPDKPNDGQDNSPRFDLLEDMEKFENGGKGSGNFGHLGRPGKVGGSAPRKGSSSGLLLSEDTIDKIVGENFYSRTLSADASILHLALAKEVGATEKPQKVSSEEYHKAIDDGGIEVYRGITGEDADDTAHMVSGFVDGEYYAGNGYDGPGIYTAEAFSDAADYGGGENGAIMKMVIPKDAKIAEEDDIQPECREFVSRKVLEYQQKSAQAWKDGNAELGDKYEELLDGYGKIEPTTYAMLKGYDVYKSEGSNGNSIYVVLNRGKVLLEKGHTLRKNELEHKHTGVVCKCHNDFSLEDYQRQLDEKEAKETLEKAYNSLKRKVQAIQREAIRMSSENVTVNAFTTNDLFTDEQKEALTRKLKNAFKKYWLILFPLFGNSLTIKRNKQFNENHQYKFTNEMGEMVDDNADTVAQGHAKTVMNDILDASNRAYTKVVEKSAAQLIIKAYKDNPDRWSKWFTKTPTEKQALQAIHDTTIIEENRRLYERANEMAWQGYDRQSIIKAIKGEFRNLSTRRAELVVTNETARAYAHSQYYADLQFLNSIGKLDAAYKELYSRTGDPCEYCQELINRGPIPFTQNFLDKGESITITENGKVKTFTANYENIASGIVHPRCHCDYRLIIRENGLEGEKVLNGGKGSGNFGHSGRPGEVGGSSKSLAGNYTREEFRKLGLTLIGGYSYFGSTLYVKDETPYLASRDDIDEAYEVSDVDIEQVKDYIEDNHKLTDAETSRLENADSIEPDGQEQKLDLVRTQTQEEARKGLELLDENNEGYSSAAGKSRRALMEEASGGLSTYRVAATLGISPKVVEAYATSWHHIGDDYEKSNYLSSDAVSILISDKSELAKLLGQGKEYESIVEERLSKILKQGEAR